MDDKIFEEIGLTNAETKIYLALLKTGLTTAGPLLSETRLQNSTLHKTLNKLVKKGFVSFIIKGKTHYYHAAEPEILLKFIKEKEEKLKSIMPELKVLQKPVEKQEAEVFEGFNGLKTAAYDMIKDVKKGDEWLFFSFYTKNPDDFENVYIFFREFDKERVKEGLVIKGILPKVLKPKTKDRPYLQYLLVDFPIPLNISIVNDKVLMMPWEDKPITFLIHSRQLAESFRTYFYSIWNKYKK